MSLFNCISSLVLGKGFGHQPSGNEAGHESDGYHRCTLEKLEDRRVLSANPVVAGITFFEADDGDDLGPDYFEVSFQGGSETTQLTHFVINGDQDNSGGRSLGDIIFHSGPEIDGAGHYHPFRFDADRSVGLVESDVVDWKVSQDGLQLEVWVTNFFAGDVLAFTIDVDEIERLRPDPIVTGTEMETTQFIATFEDRHYTMERIVGNGPITSGGTNGAGLFWDDYDQHFEFAAGLAGATLSLPSESETGHPNRTAGAWDGYQLVEKPVTISGRVFHDENLNCQQDGDEVGIAGVQLTLQKWDVGGQQYLTVAETTTDTHGDYLFGGDGSLKPGTYRIVQTQPEGYLSVGAKAGTVDGQKSGSVDLVADDQANVLSNIVIPKGDMHAINYDFCEVMPVALSGFVYHDRNDNGIREAGEEGIADVQIRVRRTGGFQERDPFANMDSIVVTTDSNGYYSVVGLPPGIYEVIQVNQYPIGNNPLDGFLNGKDRVGTVNGVTRGHTGDDHHTQILLHAGEKSINNNFGELMPVALHGYVSQADRDGNCTRPGDPNYKGIAGVTIHLYGSDGRQVATTVTRADGTFQFTGLPPGVYSIRQVQPAGFLDGQEHVGTVNGQANGVLSSNDVISQIQLMSGQTGIQYGFCEHLPASLSGQVFHDRNNDGVIDPGEEGIAGVTIRLLHADGSPVLVENGGVQTVMTAVTDSQGFYQFENLRAGQYQIQQVQPGGWIDGRDSVGSLGGTLQRSDLFTQITVRDGDTGVNYNFGEFRLSSISGYVHVDSDGNCIPDSPGDLPIAGVTMQLLDSQGNVLQQTTTNQDGYYEFQGLLPGTYAVRQIQPSDYFSGGQKVGHLSGHPDVRPGSASDNLISNIVLKSNFNVVQYNFCEHPGSVIAGRVFQDGPAFETPDGVVPSNYRQMRDGQFTPDDTPIAGVKMLLYWYIDPRSEAIAPRPVTLGEVMGQHYSHLSGGADTPIYVTTDAQGRYHFAGLPAGNYIVLQEQPAGFVDANNYVGTTTGLAFNSLEALGTAPQALLSTFSSSQLMDSIANVRVNPGQSSLQNNFTEVRAVALPPPPPQPPELPNIPDLPPANPNPLPPGVPLTGFGGLAGHQGVHSTQFVGIGFNGSLRGQLSATPQPYTWHLSIINDGAPRDAGQPGSGPWHEVGYLSELDWNRFPMDQGDWVFTTQDDDGQYKISKVRSNFGTLGGRPLVGDFNGDGIDQIAIFKDGFWFLDTNGNGLWDSQDMMIRLGNADDLPVVGDWDGDGKDDIGIFGPMWEGDHQAIQREPGLPDRDNTQFSRPKNPPPTLEESADGTRVLKKGITGRNRADVINHVFQYGQDGDIPISGDFNGDGITQIGIFNNGRWTIDSNGDGVLDANDESFLYGQSGDIPLVGDFNGDGTDQVGVYRFGKWFLDSNNNRQLDAADHVFEMEGQGYPLVGDFNGDGRDTPVLYRVETDPYRKAN